MVRVEIDFVLMIILGIAVDVTIRRKVTARVGATLKDQERVGQLAVEQVCVQIVDGLLHLGMDGRRDGERRIS
jgi:heme/copper-type cytochrome/quinol oxidase subunit 4